MEGEQNRAGEERGTSCRKGKKETYTGIRRTQNVNLVPLQLVGLDMFLTSTTGPSARYTDGSTDGQPRGGRSRH